MSRDRIRACNTGLALTLSLALAAGCSDQPQKSADAAVDGAVEGGIGLRIMPFPTPQITLPVSQTHDQWVTLSQPVSEITQVDVASQSPSVSASPIVLVFSPGEDQQKATITAISETGETYAPVLFSLRGTSSVRKLEVKVTLW